MKPLSILNESYIQYKNITENAESEANKNINTILEFVDEITNNLKMNEELDITSPEYFTFKAAFNNISDSNATERGFAELLRNRDKCLFEMVNAVECARIVDILNDNKKSSLTESLNYVFSDNSILTEDYNILVENYADIRGIIKSLNEEYESNYKNINDIMKSITKDDVNQLSESVTRVLLIEEIVSSLLGD